MFPRFSILRSIDLPCTAAEAYDFHQNPENMRAILPPGQVLQRFEGSETASPGAEITLHLRVMGLPVKWRARWAAADRPVRLVDDALESPFALFLHEHRFRALPDGSCRMTDHIMYALPLPWLSWPVAITLAYWKLSWMLRVRHERTLKYFIARQDGAGHAE